MRRWCHRCSSGGRDARRERGSGTVILAAAGVGFVAAVWLSIDDSMAQAQMDLGMSREEDRKSVV